MDGKIDLNVDNYKDEDLMDIMNVSRDFTKEDLLESAKNIIKNIKTKSKDRYISFIFDVINKLLIGGVLNLNNNDEDSQEEESQDEDSQEGESHDEELHEGGSQDEDSNEGESQDEELHED